MMRLSSSSSNIFVLLLTVSLSCTVGVAAFSAPTSSKIKNEILILDHLNINHEKGRHDWLKAFYVDFLQCALDPRKMENVELGKKTVWCNIGANQFHLPEGKPDAQVLDGVITLGYPDLSALRDRVPAAAAHLEGSQFAVQTDESSLVVIDPWGSHFRLVPTGNSYASPGRQPGPTSEGCGMLDLTIHTPLDANLAGIGRFYTHVLGSVVTQCNDNDKNELLQIQVGPQQTLTFRPKASTTVTSHVDLRQDSDTEAVASPTFPSNYGPHISLYVSDLAAAYQRADALGLTYVNLRFQRRAYNVDQALDQCMFRALDIVDPENPDAGPILQLEHEIRSVVRRDGRKYKSCPLEEIPPECR